MAKLSDWLVKGYYLNSQIHDLRRKPQSLIPRKFFYKILGTLRSENEKIKLLNLGVFNGNSRNIERYTKKQMVQRILIAG